MILGGDTVTRLRAPVITGPDGAPMQNWNSDESSWDKVDYANTSLQPLSSTEDVVAQQRTESTHRWYGPAGADVRPTDRLRFDGFDYLVDGEPYRWRFGSTDHHIEVLCIRIQGG